MYHIPTVELIVLTSERLMGMAGQSDPDHQYGGAPARSDSAPGDMRSF